MATITAVKQDTTGMVGILLYLWEALTAANLDGSRIRCPQYTDKTVQILGTFDGATCTMQGSNDGSTWFSLTDPQGNAIAKAAAAGEAIIESPLWIRPLVSGAGAGTDLDVYIICRGTR